MTIQERFEKLERINRRWRSMAIAMGLLVAAGLLMAQGRAGGVVDEIQARRIHVLDKKGVPVITLESSQRGGRLVTTNAQGQLFFEVGSGEVSIHDDHGHKLARISATKEGQGMIATYNHKGEGVVALGATKDGKGAMTTYNGQGQKQVVLSATDTGGAVTVWNYAGKEVVGAKTDENGIGFVGAWDHDGTGRKLAPGR